MAAGVTDRFILIRPYLYLIAAFDAGNEFRHRNIPGAAGALLLADITALHEPSSNPRAQVCPSGQYPIS